MQNVRLTIEMFYDMILENKILQQADRMITTN